MKTFTEFLNEFKDEKTVKVDLRDAVKAHDIADDMFRGTYKNNGSDVFVFKYEDDAFDFIDELKKAKVEIVKN